MSSYDFAIANQLAQGLASLLLAFLLWLFLRLRRRRYLLHLALSFSALTISLTGGAASLALGQYGDPLGLPRQMVTVIALGALPPHLIWLWLGIHGSIRLKSFRIRREPQLIIAGAFVGMMVAVLAGWLAARGMTGPAHGVRHTLPYLAGGATYIALSLAMFRARGQASEFQISPLVATLSFGAYGLHLVYSASLTTWMVVQETFIPHSQYVGLAGLLLLMTIALSSVIWLLETEQRRASSARDQARAAERRLLYFRTHDPATGLPNRRQMQDLLGREMLALRRKPESQIGILSVGLHQFKVVSEAMGQHQTEDLMRELTRRIRDRQPRRFLLGRTGERDFLILMPDIRRRDRAIAHATAILDQVRQPFRRNDHDLVLKPSGGLCFAPDDATTAPDLIQYAERAQMQAAAAGEDLLLHRSRTDQPEPRDMLQVESELRRAHKDGQFVLFYQPLISIRQRCIIGFEALLRWEHPERGLLNPAYFLQDASALGVLDELEDQLFDNAVAQLADWHSDFSLTPVTVSINVSPQRFTQPDLPDRLSEICARHGVSPEFVNLEITENSAISDFEAGLETIGRLRERGIKVSLDDFGTGYSALAHLQRLKVDYVKLDRSFITGIESDDRQLALTHAIVELIHSLDMQVVAEGVETREQLGYMIKCRVDFVQGFLLGKPLPAADYRDMLEKRHITAF
ncbi:MAG: phosphodiesterase [Wenzhouxiangella sp.]|nr:MAG: phosphodiesterase [Wenzhouxiangella sp.]